MNSWRTLLPNAWYIAVREYRSRVRTRSFVLGTALLAVIAFAATQMPVLIDYTSSTTQTRVVVVIQATGMPSNSLALFTAQLTAQPADPNARTPFVISWLAPGDEAATQKALESGKYDRSEEHTSELQSRQYLVCRLLL